MVPEAEASDSAEAAARSVTPANADTVASLKAVPARGLLSTMLEEAEACASALDAAMYATTPSAEVDATPAEVPATPLVTAALDELVETADALAAIGLETASEALPAFDTAAEPEASGISSTVKADAEA